MDISALGYLAGWRIVNRLPESWARALFRAGADVATARGVGTQQFRRNMARVLRVSESDVPDELVKAGMRSYARYWMEAFRLPSLAASARRDELVDHIESRIRGVENLAQAHARGKGVVLALTHSGNWDMAGLWLASRYGGFATVAERLKPEAVFDAFLKYRESLGFTVIPNKGGPRPPMEILSETVKDGGIVALLGERDLKRRGVPVEFFGEPTTMPVGSAVLAKEHGASLLAVQCWFEGNREWGFSISEPISTSGSIQEIVQELATHFEQSIGEHPQDWHMLQRLWDEKA